MKGIKKYISLYLDEAKIDNDRQRAETLLFHLGLSSDQVDRVLNKYWNNTHFGTSASSYILVTEGFKESLHNKDKLKFKVTYDC